MTQSRQEYIEKYSEYAMDQMRRYGIPASVTLAQGIIESAEGKSMLARTANNHFGVKGEYDGAYVLANDDKADEKFKKYENAGQSFEDHSKVLMAERYRKHTQNLSPTDYRGWAEGIKAGGYATAKHYVDTICSVIENADLQKYDKIVIEQARKEGKEIGTRDYSRVIQSPSLVSQSSVAVTDNLYSLPLKREEFMLVTSNFGNRKDPMDQDKTQFHKGIDISCRNETLLATENNGRVINVNHNAGSAGGKSVTIEYDRHDGSRYQATYMHMSDINVKVDDIVNAGQKIGVSGNTGSRTTGPHLHFEVKTISKDGSSRIIDPSAYIAEISQKGGLSQQLLYNGKDLLAEYRREQTTNPILDEGHIEMKADASMSPDDWMKKLLSSEDSGLGMSSIGDPVIEMAMTLFTSLIALATQMDNKNEEEQMHRVTEAAVNRQIDLRSLCPNFKECSLSVSSGNPVLRINNGNESFSHELINAELTKVQTALGNNKLSDTEKQRIISSVITNITISHQISRNFEEGLSSQNNQQEALIRK